MDRARLNHLAIIAKTAEVPMLATTEPLYHDRTRGIVQDVVTCIRDGVTIADAGFLLAPNHERFIYAPEDIARELSRCKQNGGLFLPRLPDPQGLVLRRCADREGPRHLRRSQDQGPGGNAQKLFGI